VPASAGGAAPPDFDAQCEAFLRLRPLVVSSIMGLFSPALVSRLRAAGIAWFATATTLAEAKAARDAGADAVIAQGFEAGGHRGSFDAARAADQAVGLVSLLPCVADHSTSRSSPPAASPTAAASRPRSCWARARR
jgi:nitronate monooxygenase